MKTGLGDVQVEVERLGKGLVEAGEEIADDKGDHQLGRRCRHGVQVVELADRAFNQSRRAGPEMAPPCRP
jgi:hypothetical protein